MLDSVTTESNEIAEKRARGSTRPKRAIQLCDRPVPSKRVAADLATEASEHL